MRKGILRTPSNWEPDTSSRPWRDPGLVYDASYRDYLLFLCDSSGNRIDPSFHCPEEDDVPSASHFNYPSVAIDELEDGRMKVARVVTNVGPARSTYTVEINQPPGYTVEISPAVLRFSAVNAFYIFSVLKLVVSPRTRRERFLTNAMMNKKC